jgi:hypothetical protein
MKPANPIERRVGSENTSRSQAETTFDLFEMCPQAGVPRQKNKWVNLEIQGGVNGHLIHSSAAAFTAAVSHANTKSNAQFAMT